VARRGSLHLFAVCRPRTPSAIFGSTTTSNSTTITDY
jgi:hypothetical protein